MRTRWAMAVAAAVAGALAISGAGLASPAPRDESPSEPGGCVVLPGSDAFHQNISTLPEASNSEDVISRILADGGDTLHPDFGSNPNYGIPFEVVPPDQKRVKVKLKAYPDESDPGPHPIPRKARIEGGKRSNGDRHVLVLEQDSDDTDSACRLIELYRAFPPKKRKPWKADQASVFDLGRTLPQRPDGWTSADAAGLPILPGLIRYPEVEAGFIDHAIRITFERTRRAYLSPASHFASEDCGATLPPMGMRLRLRAGYELGGMSDEARTIAQALKTYGAIVADNGSNFFITGASDRRWDDEALGDLKEIPGDAFEVVDTGAQLTDGCD
ncbi:MAG TPA: hypothetical protein VD766_10630 [Solirubrobacterales bacterium]|nr:hypothetical protein [Solirubrobacterales bacterium]